jgi:hypothetical protein
MRRWQGRHADAVTRDWFSSDRLRWVTGKGQVELWKKFCTNVPGEIKEVQKHVGELVQKRSVGLPMDKPGKEFAQDLFEKLGFLDEEHIDTLLGCVQEDTTGAKGLLELLAAYEEADEEEKEETDLYEILITDYKLDEENFETLIDAMRQVRDEEDEDTLGAEELEPELEPEPEPEPFGQVSR